MSEKSEKAYLAELVQTFPPERPLSIEEAWDATVTRFKVFESNVDQILNLIRQQETFPKPFFTLIFLIHAFLFDGIFSNAGKPRLSSDPGGGFVAFGSERDRNPSGSQFTGIAPSKIVVELDKAAKVLTNSDENPIRSSILFYQQFAYIHPFYDGNGRIGRFIVTLYLRQFDLYVQWKQLHEHQSRFFKKLNQCHLRVGQQQFNKYFDYLFTFWEKFVVEGQEDDS